MNAVTQSLSPHYEDNSCRLIVAVAQSLSPHYGNTFLAMNDKSLICFKYTTRQQEIQRAHTTLRYPFFQLSVFPKRDH